MPVERKLGAGLIAHIYGSALDIDFPSGSSGLGFVRDGDVVRASLRFGTTRLIVDVSFQPGAIIREIDQTAREAAIDPNRWRLAVLAALRDWSGTLAWCPQEAERLLAAIGALSHPMLGHVYQRGHGAIAELPRWAVPVLRATNPTSAARTLAGDKATRRLARALAASLVARPAPACVELGPLSVAVMAAGLVSVDELANVLEAGTHERTARMPSTEEVREVRRGLELFAPNRRAMLLVDVARRHDGVALAATMKHLWWVRDKAEHPLPARLDDLREMCGRLVPVLAPLALTTPRARPARVELEPAQQMLAPEPVPAGGGRPVAQPAFPEARFRQRVAEPRVAPRAPRVHADRWPIQPELWRIHGFTRDDLSYVVPTSTNELRSWGRILATCVGDYGAAVAGGVSWVIGVQIGETLIGCIELQPRDRRVRQALGPRNTPLPPATLQRVLSALEDCGVTPLRTTR